METLWTVATVSLLWKYVTSTPLILSDLKVGFRFSSKKRCTSTSILRSCWSRFGLSSKEHWDDSPLIPPPLSFPIFIRSLSRDSICLNVCSSYSISWLQSPIYNFVHIPLGFQKLVYVGGLLSVDFSLKIYSITQDASISLIYQLWGGFDEPLVPFHSRYLSFKDVIQPNPSVPAQKSLSGPAFPVEHSKDIPIEEVKDSDVYSFSTLY